MLSIEDFSKAFELVERYEKYKLIKAWGIIIIITGIGRFFLSWIIDQTFLFSLNMDYEITFRLALIFRTVVQFLLIFSLALVLILTYLSLKKTVLRRGGEIVSTRDVHFGLALIILFYLTFIARFIGSIYWEEVISIFLCYFILKRGIKIEFKEMLYLGIILLIISIIEFIGRVFMVINLYGQPSFSPIWILFYLSISVLFMLPYIVSGRRIIETASHILEER
ncbi:MAG: hypothetical protein ACFFAU_20540 [Candidatus Hodarchaeota archaeon]